MAISGDARRAGRELVLELVFRPPASALVSLLARLRVAPPAVVVANAAVGLVAALALALDHLLTAAVLLQLKTLLDNSDGELARVTGRVTRVGRYLDTEADLVVNAAVFAALGYATGEALLAAAGFVALAIVLAVDYKATELDREAHGVAQPLPPATRSRAERALTRFYDVVYGRLDRSLRRVLGRADLDRFTVTVLANLGLSTQLLALGICLALGGPEAYLWIVLSCLLLVVALQVRAERRAREGPTRRREA